ncbi:hypothetical protein GCM10007916_00960 [Psychromonas marina]|uniref:Glycosyl transferase family 1 domain-containing protein n=1 Tax=Psychromonas marina TaxID=88364 RepID=A0ABQ6DV85_9GAMM|nr:glycosyltransferase [Psychromonas marina]GLS89029.1 hypothetical protein GCM10007916_00960 [Psychromonas marina]
MSLKVILTSNMYLPNTGGIENSLNALAKVGASKGDEITIITSNIFEGNDNLPSGLELNNGFKVRRYNTSSSGNKVIRVFQYIHSAIKTYRDGYKESKDTIIIARYHWNVIFAFLAGFRDIRYVVPGVVKFQNNKKNRKDIKKFSSIVEHLIQKLALKISSNIFVFSKSMKNQVTEVCSNISVQQVSPGVDFSRFEMKPFNPSQNTVNLLTVSRLVSAKGINYAIEAMAYLPSHYKLQIVGDGPDDKILKGLCKKLDLEDRVSFLGKQSKPEELYRSSDVFLLPSIYEPFGQTILEASVSGLPVVSFDSTIVNTSTRDILGEHGFYANEVSAEVYAKNIQLAYEKHCADESLAKITREYVINRYTWENLYSDITEKNE